MPPHRNAALFLSAGLALLSATLPARAQELEAVQGFVATATLRYRAVFANMLGSAPGTVTYNYRVRIADGIASATVSRDVEAFTSLGPGEASANHSFSGPVARSRQSSSGRFLWAFSSGTLTLLDPAQTGGFRLTVRFRHDGRHIVCDAIAPYIRDGSPAASLSRLAFGGQVVIAEMRQTASRCAVSTS
jgi:hypothetical protein